MSINTNKFVFALDPKHDDIYNMWLKHMAAFWTPNEVTLSEDLDDWRNKLNDKERQYIITILAFFAASDGIVNANLVEQFMQEIDSQEVKAFYGFQYAMETVHARTYAMLIETYIEDNEERNRILNAIETVNSVKMKAEWALKWMNDSAPLAQRIAAFIIVEGVLFSGSFCGIFWFKKRGLMKELSLSNELISRDEALHTDTGILMYNKVTEGQFDNIGKNNTRLSTESIHNMMEEALKCEREFIRESLPEPLVGMNSTLMIQYVEYVADHLLYRLGYKPLYNATNPFDWMNLISVDSKANFFERKVTEYQKYNRSEFEVLSLEQLK